MPKCKYANVQVCQCASMQMCKYSNVQGCKCANVKICKCVNVQVCKCASIQICKCVSQYKVLMCVSSLARARDLWRSALLFTSGLWKHCLKQHYINWLYVMMTKMTKNYPKWQNIQWKLNWKLKKSKICTSLPSNSLKTQKSKVSPMARRTDNDL